MLRQHNWIISAGNIIKKSNGNDENCYLKQVFKAKTLKLPASGKCLSNIKTFVWKINWALLYLMLAHILVKRNRKVLLCWNLETANHVELSFKTSLTEIFSLSIYLTPENCSKQKWPHPISKGGVDCKAKAGH